jgi:hypothetical protein
MSAASKACQQLEEAASTFDADLFDIVVRMRHTHSPAAEDEKAARRLERFDLYFNRSPPSYCIPCSSAVLVAFLPPHHTSPRVVLTICPRLIRSSVSRQTRGRDRCFRRGGGGHEFEKLGQVDSAIVVEVRLLE